MTRPTPVAVDPVDGTFQRMCLLPLLLVLTLLGSSVAGAPPVPPDAADHGIGAVVVRGSEEASPAEVDRDALDGRSRLEMSFGVSDVYVTDNSAVDAVEVTGGAFSLVFLHWIDERFAFDVSLGIHNVGVSSRKTVVGDVVDADGFGGVMAGGRFYPPLNGAFRPHVGLALGPVTEMRVHDRPWQTDVVFRTTTLGLGVEAGIDLLLGRHFVVGVRGGAVARDGYYPLVSLGINLGWAFGGAG